MDTQLFAALDRDWAVLCGSYRARNYVQRWSDDPALRHITSLGELVVTVRDGADDPEATDQILAGLARRAPDDDVAARTLLHAVLPGLINVAKRLGHGRVDDELAADVVAEAVGRIRTYPISRRPQYIAANITWDVFGRLARQRRRATPIAAEVRFLPIAVADTDPSDEVCELVGDALHRGKLRDADARLILGIAIGHDTIARHAAREGISYEAMCERWRRTLNRLRRAAAA